jgi:hypothetical protein
MDRGFRYLASERRQSEGEGRQEGWVLVNTTLDARAVYKACRGERVDYREVIISGAWSCFSVSRDPLVD